MSRAARPCNRFCSLLLGLALLMPASLPLSAAETVAPPSPRTLIIDTDPGADDVIALLFAMASPKELKIQALTTVAGNVPLEKTARNARLARESGERRIFRSTPAPRDRCCARRSTPPTCTAAKASAASRCMSRSSRWPKVTPWTT